VIAFLTEVFLNGNFILKRERKASVKNNSSLHLFIDRNRHYQGIRKRPEMWMCTMCGFEYYEDIEGTKFSMLPDDWKYPVCQAPKGAFERII
jgi:rubredoxin